MNKKAKLDSGLINTIIMTILVIIILFQAYATILPEATDTGDELAGRGTELTVESRCTDVSCFWNTSRIGDTLANNATKCSHETCFWNSTRTVDCTTHNVSKKDSTKCDYGNYRSADCSGTDNTFLDDIVCPNTYKATPLGSIFTGSGIIFIIVMLALVITIIVNVLKPNAFK